MVKEDMQEVGVREDMKCLNEVYGESAVVTANDRGESRSKV